MSIVANVVVDSFVFPMGATGRQRVISYGSSLRSITRQEKVGSRFATSFASNSCVFREFRDLRDNSDRPMPTVGKLLPRNNANVVPFVETSFRLKVDR